MKLKKLFISLLLINTISLIAVVFIISKYNYVIKELENAYIVQHKSLVLADELRQSSDDLTRVARTYVITGNIMYKKQFQTILDIRNGIKPRPKNYNRIFWDFLAIDGSKEVLDGEKIPLRELMKKAGFTNDELSLLYKSQQESDDLTYLETKAMNAIIGVFQDSIGKYTKKGKPNFKLAREIMHSQEYHEAKISIMKPLDKFYVAFEKRTKIKVLESHAKVKELESYVSIAIVFLIILVLFSFFIILSRMIYPLEILNNTMLRLAKNDMEVPIPVYENKDEVGSMVRSVEIFKDNAIKLIDSEQKNKLLLDLAGDGIFGLDSYGKFTFLNPTACKLLGYKRQEDLIGKYIFNTITSQRIKNKSSLKEKLLLVKKKDMSFKTKDEDFFPIDYVSTPIYSKDYDIDGSVVVFSDITSRKENENRLKKAIEDAKSANHSKSIFLANMSHELRTPLNAILGFTSLLIKSQKVAFDEKENLRTIKSSGEHLLTLINEILELSKIEAGKIDIKPIDFNLLSSIEDIKDMFSSRCKEKGISFNIYVDKSVPVFIKCDEQRLRQILINLLANALNFTDNGSIELKIYTKFNQLFCEVKDTGIGINDSDKKLIFKPFEQLESSKYTNKGTGLGLSITKELVNRMGGEIKVESKLSKGTVFSFFIDFVVSTKDNVLEQDNEKDILGITNEVNDKRILVADDIKENRMLLVQILKQFNFDVIEANDGLEVIKILKDKNIDLIYMDILMPNLDGFETTKKIRRMQLEIPIVVVSAHAFKEDKQKALSVGANCFIAKPIEYKAIMDTLQKYLNIEFIYDKSKIDKKEQVIVEVSTEVLIKIQQASRRLDNKTIELLITSNDFDINLAQKINKYIKTYNFEKIDVLCEKIIQKS
ncbi:response regulator [Sulfurospirillum arcachonense]|uniref:response regulator n=1 Tax=Sulfurospirillum arcachonense TaxID=57666 RepID=UPI000468E6B5|nr:response regulator [Sulfurospirillum arcachonense]